MALPKAVTFKRVSGKSTVQYTSSIDRTKYLLVELERAALRDIGKFLRNKILDEVRKMPGMRRGKRPLRAFQFWVRRRSGNLWVGVKHNTWYGVAQELGNFGQPKRRIITNTTMQNVDEVRMIAAQYLSSIEDEIEAAKLIDEDDEGVNEE